MTDSTGGGIGRSTFADLGGAANDIFAGFGDQYKAKGNRLEAENYDRAAGFADLNAQFTETTTNIKTAQQQRQLFQQEGGLEASVQSAGFNQSGSAMDLLRQTHQQGELEKAVLQQQGQITEQGYKVEAENYRNMAKASRLAADAQKTASIGHFISGGIKAGAAVAPLLL